MIKFKKYNFYKLIVIGILFWVSIMSNANANYVQVDAPFSKGEKIVYEIKKADAGKESPDDAIIDFDQQGKSYAH